MHIPGPGRVPALPVFVGVNSKDSAESKEGAESEVGIVNVSMFPLPEIPPTFSRLYSSNMKILLDCHEAKK